MNPLDRFPRVREALYLIQWVVTGAQTVLSAYFTFALGQSVDSWPEWFLASLAVAPVLWTYLGITAKGNVTTTGSDEFDLPTRTIHGGTGYSEPGVSGNDEPLF